MSIGHRLAYNVVVNVIAKVGSTVLALVAIGMVTRYLGTTGFGTYATALAYFALFMAIADFGLYQIMTREIGHVTDSRNEQRIVERVFTMRLAISGTVAAIAVSAAVLLGPDSQTRTAIVLVALAFFLSSSYALFNGVFQKHLRMDLVVITEFAGKIVQVMWIYAAIRTDAGLTWIVASVAAAMAFDLAVILLLVRRFVRPRIVPDTAFARSFLRQSYPMGIAAVITFLYFKADTLLLAHLQSAEAVGIYNGAYKIMENLIFFPSMVMGLMLPILSRTIDTDRALFDNYASKTLKVFLVIIVPIVVGVLFTADDIMRVVGGEAFVVSAPVLRTLVIALFFIFFGQFFTILLLTGNLQKLLLQVLAVCAAVNIVSNLVLIPRFSHMGAAAVSVITEALVVILCASVGARRLGYIPHIPQFWRIATSGALLALVLVAVGPRDIFVIIPIAVGVYAGALWLTSAIGIDEVRSMIRRPRHDDAEAAPTVTV